MIKTPTIIQENRRLRVSQYRTPKEIQLQGDRLFWQPVKEWREVKPTTDTFEHFLGLAESSDSAILKFAQRWGVLWLCKKHTEPISDMKHWNCVPLNPNPLEQPEGYPGEATKAYFASEGEP